MDLLPLVFSSGWASGVNAWPAVWLVAAVAFMVALQALRRRWERRLATSGGRSS